MTEWLNSMAPHWAWLTVGVLLCAAEIIAPGFFLVWLGVAAIATGVLAFLLPIGVPMQLGVFAVLAFIALYGARRWLKANPIVSSDPLLNQRGGRLIGEVLTLVTAIENGRGRARVGDGEWPVRGPDAAEGTKVRVVSADGGVLVVEAA
ncbi:NfeD family protein [Sphingopyxis sp.]|jgi:membrane protein implicated in regulation of membrane protease activity|uniref:NfeD family protein n=1 Tax=Sphingopyxis sp. TaxID=1908224 RepID=UPI0025E9C4AF|nr:NfeD family protein [Sphingopyxis sp.]MBK6411774.1 NfeD family protein [Sphingopyxis sp.]